MITSISFGPIVAMAAYLGDPVDDARKSFSNCLVRYSIEHLELKTSARSFKQSVSKACPSESRTFRDIVMREEIKIGEAKSAAEAYADEEIEILVEVFANNYKDHLDAGTSPIEET